MKRREMLASATAGMGIGAAGASLAAAPAVNGGRVLKNMGTAGPGLGARIAATRAEGKTWDIVEYAHEKGLGAAHISLAYDTPAAEIARIRKQVNDWDMRLTVGVRTPKTDADLPRYEATVKACAEMDGRVACVHDSFSGRRYEQFKSAAEYHKFFGECKAAVQRAEPVLRKHKMPLAIENHKGWRSGELAQWVKSTGSEYVGVCLDLVNNVSLIETPQQTIDTLAPYTIFVSFKDIGVDFYDEGILLSEVPFGDGHLDLAGLVARFQKQNPKMLFQLEMLTRDPLQVPVFTEAYWKVYDDKSPAPAADLAMLVRWIREHPPKKPLPRTTGLNAKQRLALEDACNQRSIDYARQHLTTL
jgi:3-oxoisoapionate decarboxylase